MLVYHDAILLKSAEAVAIKLLSEKACRMPQGVDSIIDNQIIFIDLGAQKAQAVGIKNRHAGIIQTHGVVGEKVTTHINKNMVRFYHIDFFNLRIAGQLAGYAAVAATDNQNLFHMGMHSHGHMDNHLIVNKFVLLRKNDGAIAGNKAAKLLRVKHIDTLKIRILTKKLLFDFDI